MKQTEAAKKIINLWPQWPHAVGENLSDDALRFVGWLKLRHPDVLDFRSAEAKLGLIVGWLSADRAITESYRRGELLQEHLSAPAQPYSVNGYQMRAPIRKTSNGGAAASKPSSNASAKKVKSKSTDKKDARKTSVRKAKANAPAAKPKSKAPAKKPKASTKRAKSPTRSVPAKSAKSKTASKSKKNASAGKAAKRRPHA